MRKLISIAVVLFLLAMSALPVFAQEEEKILSKRIQPRTVTFQIGSEKYTVNGEEKTMDVAPFVENGRTYVPMRFLLDALGVPSNSIEWDSKNSVVTVKDPYYGFIAYTVGSKVIRSGFGMQDMDVVPVLRDSRVFLPAKYVASNFGYKVRWNPESETVICWPYYQDENTINK